MARIELVSSHVNLVTRGDTNSDSQCGSVSRAYHDDTPLRARGFV